MELTEQHRSVAPQMLADPASLPFPAKTESLSLTLGYLGLSEGTSAYGDLIEIGTFSKYSHVVMIFCKSDDIVPADATEADLKNKIKTDWYCFEAKPSSGDGVHLTSWINYAAQKSDSTRCALRPFIYSDQNLMPTHEDLNATWTKYQSRPYENQYLELIASAILR